MSADDSKQMTRKLAEASIEAEKLRNTISLLEGQLQKRGMADSELAKARVELGKLNEQAKQKDATLEEQKKQLAELSAKHQAELNGMRERLQAELKAKSAELDASKKSNATLEATNSDLSAKSETQQSRIKDLEAELAKLRGEAQTATAKEQIQGLTNEVRGVVQKTTELEAEANQTRDQNEKLLKKIDKLKVQLKVYQEEKISAGRSGVPPPVGKVTLVFTDVQGECNVCMRECVCVAEQ
jgi:DNA repair exonuclease SbcCD ATPase subunit